MGNKVTFHINNMAYTIEVDKALEEELTKHLRKDESLDTRELLAAYIRIAQEHVSMKEDLELISNKIPKL